MVNYKLLWIILKTLPRDLIAITRILKIWIKIAWARRKNETVGQQFTETVHKHPHKICFYFGIEQWSFVQVQQLTNMVGNYFFSQGYKKGDVIGILMQNCPEYMAIWLGLSKIGVVPALVNTNLRLGEHVKYSFQVVNCAAVIYNENLSHVIQDVISLGCLAKVPIFSFTRDADVSISIKSATNLAQVLKYSSSTEPRPSYPIKFDDKLFYVYTSDPKLFPKPILIKHSRFLTYTWVGQMSTGVTQQDKIYCPLPLYHFEVGMFGLSQCLIYGTGVVIRKTFCVSNFWLDCLHHNVTVIQCSGDMHQILLAQPKRLEDRQHKIRLMFGNGLESDVWEEFLNRFKINNIMQVYSSEWIDTTTIMSFNNNCKIIGAAFFIPKILYPFYSLKLIRIDFETGEIIRNSKTGLATRCQVGEIGELVQVLTQKLYSNFKIGNKTKTDHSMFKKKDIVLRSGDLFMMDERGYFYYQGRISDNFGKELMCS